jgi:2-amino-4-hydroxy-6-hydroxymethyldihydropteridine diphosphokinase
MAARQDPGARVWYLGLGSNVGDRAAFIREAVRRLDETPCVTVQATSSFYETDPWGETDQAPFVNAVARVVTALGPHELLAEAKRVEEEAGRQPRRRWGPREIDIDLLLSGDLRIDTPELTVPHPHLMERQFVLVPLAELDPNLQLLDGSTVSSHVTHDGSVRTWTE